MAEFSIDEYFRLIINYQFGEARSYRTASVPDTLYKFYPLYLDNADNEKRLATFARNAIWVSEVSMMNDPFEFKTIYVDRHTISKHFTENVINYYEGLFLAGMQNYSLASFSANANNKMPMWAHYANNHHGFCVRYRVHDKNNFRNIIYEDKRIPLNTLFIDMERERLKNENRGLYGYGQTLILLAAITQEQFFLKHSSWKFEEEYRFLVDTSNRAVKSYEEKCEDLGIEVEGITAGVNCSPKHLEDLHKICISNGWRPPVRAVISGTHFQIGEAVRQDNVIAK